MTCHWFLGLLWFRSDFSHQLPASTHFYWVEISLQLSLNHPRLIIPNKVHLSLRRLHEVAFILYFSMFDHTTRCVWDVTVSQEVWVTSQGTTKFFPLGRLTSANLSVIRGETLPYSTMRCWYDMCQQLLLLIIFSLLRIYSAEPFM